MDRDRKPTLLQAAKQILKQSKRPMSCGEIVAQARRLGAVSLQAKTPEKTLNASINRHIARNGAASTFKKVERGRYTVS